MKKLLALVLALVMSMSLVTISNAAFKDADKIDYKEAVDVMNAVGVFAVSYTHLDVYKRQLHDERFELRGDRPQLALAV